MDIALEERLLQHITLLEQQNDDLLGSYSSYFDKTESAITSTNTREELIAELHKIMQKKEI